MDTQKGLPIAMRPSIQMPINPMNDSVSLSRATRFGVALGVSLLGLLMPSLEAKADASQVFERCVLKDEFSEVKEAVADLQETVPNKADVAVL